jgi:polyphosphate glucokinase
MKVLGIDIGGTGIKGAVVDTKHGVLKSDRLRLLTPEAPTPDAVAGVVRTLTRHFDWDGAVGCTFPGVVRDGTIETAANLTPDWIGVDSHELFASATGCPVHVLNDADAAGVAEQRFGAADGQAGVVILVTLGTGIGSALLVDGHLVPNTELGHLPLQGGDAEKYAAESVREHEGLSWQDWGSRVGEYLRMVEELFWPHLFILGGGVSKKADRYLSFIDTRTEVVPARLLNQAGIVGAALRAEHELPKKKSRKKS